MGNTLSVNAIEITENLFFAIFGQKGTENFSLNINQQPKWTVYFFKVSFSLYMLVSVIVLINLLIAMMTDTYHNIQSQSDIEWKYGLSKLVRKMQKTRTAPFPLNLVTTWAEYIKNACVKERIARQKIRSRGYMEPDAQRIFPKFSTNSRMLPLPRAAKERINFSLLQSNSTTSQTSLNNIPKIQNIVDWDIVRRKYRMRFGDEIEKPSSGEVTLAKMA
ncbi:PREDICTED: transient-receptor-potential-like protein [Atta cephalotes]|uniref:Ion transport domain-containing protein n=1 Tax=Atta cephalotes TaxID=12957 RepID=A0A158NZ78_ATTCE|nr:PREDICTED: transient-receptor-potential-like protein [Atta cephalotes]